ncbi:MAG: type II toxin-antitoxin system RelE/ParE family toxin [Myxococcales bacterium]|nr:type II toxin-antitoxin system RelE/ParE family toxin [Myxococcales bacterium]
MKIVLSPEAVDDLEAIFDYILEDNPHMATVVLERIQARIAELASSPHLGRPGRVPGTRELVIPRTPFIVPYEVVGDVVEVLRVYHGARQWPDEL